MRQRYISFRKACLIGLLVLLIWVLCRSSFHEHYSDDSMTEDDQHIRFYSKVEAIQLFKSDPDAYFERLTPLDLHAMRVRDADDAIDRMCKASRSFTLEEKVKMTKAMEDADDFLRTVRVPYFDGVKCADLPWKVVVTRGKENEEGMPHTKGDVIYVSDEVVREPMIPLTVTMIHEKVHVYERLYPHLMAKWIKANGYQLYRRQSTIPTARSNPDVDGWTYLDPNGKETVVHYNVTYKTNPNPMDERFSLSRYATLPNGIQDATYPHGDDPASEHPNETLAYKIDHMYSQQARQ